MPSNIYPKHRERKRKEKKKMKNEKKTGDSELTST